MTHISPHLNPPHLNPPRRARLPPDDRFALLHKRQRQLELQDRVARTLLAASIIAAAVITGYLLGITQATADALPALLDQAAARAAW